MGAHHKDQSQSPTKSSTGSSGKGTLKQTQHCACEKNWCPVCSLPKCRPIRDTHWAKGTLNSTYLHDYDEKKGRPGEPGWLAYKDKQLVPGQAGFDPATTYNKDYARKQGPRWPRRPDGTAMPYRPFDGRTTYNTYHNGRKGLPLDARTAPAAIPSAPFAGVSTQRADFQDWGPQNRPYTAPPERMPHLPFMGNSTYREDYHKKDIPDRELRLPPPLLPSKNDPNSTTYGVDYVEKPIYKPVGECCDNPVHPSLHIHKPPAFAGTGTNFMGNTTGRLYRL